MTLAMQALAMSNHFEIAASQAALNKQVADNVKQFAQRMVSDHTKNQQQLQEMAQRLKVALPTDEGVANRLRILSMEPLNGRDFERAYLRAQVDGHESAALFLETALRMMEQGQGAGNQNAGQGNQGNLGAAGGSQAGQGANTAQDMTQLRQFLQTTLATVRQHLQQATQLYQSVSK